MPLTRRIIAERITAIAPELQQLGVSRVALFGSYLRDAATPHSDVDLLVDFKPGRKTFRSLVSLTERLEGGDGEGNARGPPTSASDLTSASDPARLAPPPSPPPSKFACART